MPFKSPAGLYALLALVPFIIIYLRRPKPKEKTIPSLMFFMKDRGVTKLSNLFKQLLNNLLFLVQLAFILSAAFAVAIPFFTSQRAASAQQTIVVVDGSGSMNAMLSDGSGTRFERAVSEAGSMIEGTAGVVLAENVPVIVLDRGSAGQARKILATLMPRSTETSIGDSMLTAGELIPGDGKNSKVVVVSDFQANKGTDAIVAKRSLAARGINVQLVNVLDDKSELGKLSNVGFIGLQINKFQTTAMVRNYDEVDRKIDVQITNNNQQVDKRQMLIGPRSTEELSFETMHGSTELEITQSDDLKLDNKLFISSPSKKVKTLLITNSDTSYVLAALKSSPNIELTVAYPPVIKSFGYDVIILYNASSKLMLPGFYKEINKAVQNGTGLVIAAQDDLATYAKQFSMPADIRGMGNASKASVNIENYVTKGVDFGVVAKYQIVNPKDGFTTLVTADDGSALLGTYGLGSGIAAYYGLPDDFSTFKSSYSYPIFWDNAMSFLTNSEDIASFNIQAGKMEGISEQKVETPSGELTTSRLFMDESGFYTFDGKTIAVNMISRDESDICSTDSFEIVQDDSKLATQEVKVQSDVLIDRKLMLLALGLLVFELLLIKMRGDL